MNHAFTQDPYPIADAGRPTFWLSLWTNADCGLALITIPPFDKFLDLGIALDGLASPFLDAAKVSHPALFPPALLLPPTAVPGLWLEAPLLCPPPLAVLGRLGALPPLRLLFEA